MTHPPAPAPLPREELDRLPKVLPIEHPYRPDEAEYERGLLRRQMEKFGNVVAAQMLAGIALASPQQAAFAGSMWALYEWTVAVINERDALLAEIEAGRAGAERGPELEAERTRLFKVITEHEGAICALRQAAQPSTRADPAQVGAQPAGRVRDDIERAVWLILEDFAARMPKRAMPSMGKLDALAETIINTCLGPATPPASGAVDDGENGNG